jgi:hypothetical protein
MVSQKLKKENMDYIQFCNSNKNNVLYLLQTDLVGEEVDNGMGVEFELKRFVIISIKGEGKTNFDDVMWLEVSEDENHVKDMLARLASDGYVIIWKNEEYSYPQPVIGTIQRLGTEVTLKVERTYSFKITYEDLKKYYTDRKSASEYEHDLFYYLLEKHPDIEKIATGAGWLSDQVKMQDRFYDKDGISFTFTCKNTHTKNVGPSEAKYNFLTQEDSDKFQIRFEGESKDFENIKDYIEAFLKG